MVGKGSHFYRHYLQHITYKGHRVLKTYHKVVSNDVGNHNIKYITCNYTTLCGKVITVYIPQFFNEDCCLKMVKII